MTTDTPEADWADDIERPALPTDPSDLVARLVMANVDSLAATTDRIIENLTERAETAEATLDAVRGRIGHLLDGDHMPSGRAIEAALYPPNRVIDTYRKLADQ